MAEVFVCKTWHYRPEKFDFTVAAPAGSAGSVACGFETEDFDLALAHVNADEGGRLTCWVESYEDGDRDTPVLREMHGSAHGGVYVQDFR